MHPSFHGIFVHVVEDDPADNNHRNKYLLRVGPRKSDCSPCCDCPCSAMEPLLMHQHWQMLATRGCSKRPRPCAAQRRLNAENVNSVTMKTWETRRGSRSPSCSKLHEECQDIARKQPP